MRSFAYSRTGDLLGVTDTMQGTVRYHYDKAHRIAEETLPDGSRRAFGYDPAGNLLFQPGLTDVQMGSGNCLQAANGDRFTYNDRDHLSTREGPTGTTRYEYNELDMLVRCEINGDTWTASYDALCRRIRKTWRGQTTTYYWDDFRLAAEVRHDGLLRVYVYEDYVALVPFMFVEYSDHDAEPASGKRYYIFTNQIGMPIRVEDDAGRSCWSARIDPYGRAQIAPDSRLEVPLRLPGHYYDPETGLHYNRFRYFSPELGRYLQSDPAGLEGGINLYAYPADPLTGADIDGLARKGRTVSKPSRPSTPSRRKSDQGKPEETPGGDAGCPDQTGAAGGRPPLTREEGQKIVDDLQKHADGHGKSITTTLTEHESGMLTITQSHPSRVVPPKQRALIAEMQKPGGPLEGRTVVIPDDRSKPDTHIPKDKRDLPGVDNGNHGEARGVQAGQVYNDPAKRQWSSCGAGHGGAACKDCGPMQRDRNITNETGFQPPNGSGRYDGK
jgi:RHS repeat-associated protein